MKKYTLIRSFALSLEELAPLEQAAIDRRVPKSQIVRELIRAHLLHAKIA
jgi:hypothetical protein